MARVGDKYIIEIGSVVDTPDGPKYQIKGFNTLFFDVTGLSRLEEAPCRYDDAWEDGADEAWSAAQKIVTDITRRCSKMVKRFFPQMSVSDIFTQTTAREAIDMVSDWENENCDKDIRIGDVVKIVSDGKCGVVTHVSAADSVTVMLASGHFDIYDACVCRKTGRFLDQVGYLLDHIHEGGCD